MNSKKEQYTLAELIFAATARCPCGAGIAYPRDVEPRGESAYWDCSAILTGTADVSVQHTAKLPFVFYEIKSEKQPSACGATTRPREDDAAKRERAIAEARATIASVDGPVARAIGEQQRQIDASRERWAQLRAAAVQQLTELGAA